METIIQTEVKPLDYFYRSWGYDQTNIDYLMVQSVSPTGKTAMCRMASPIDLGTQGQQDVLTPGSCYGEPFRMHIKRFDDGTVYLVGTYPYCKGGRTLGRFWRTKLGDAQYQTALGFGH